MSAPAGAELFALAGKRALVTGGSRGVGRATARLLARCGADVGIGYHSRASDADETVAELHALGVRAFSHAGDAADGAVMEAFFARALRELGGVDLVIANAGIWPPDGIALAEMSEAHWRRTIEVNLTSAFHTARLAARHVSDGGRIVLVSSTAGQRGEAFHADYAASKGALLSLAKGLCVELAPRGVTVNCVAPGWIDTEMAAAPLAAGRAAIERAIPLGRVASAEDVAGPIVFLCSALARHVTGEVLNVNGGSVLCG